MIFLIGTKSGSEGEGGGGERLMVKSKKIHFLGPFTQHFFPFDSIQTSDQNTTKLEGMR